MSNRHVQFGLKISNCLGKMSKKTQGGKGGCLTLYIGYMRVWWMWRVCRSVGRYLTSFGPTVDGRSVLPFDVRRMTTSPPEQTGFGRVDLLLAIIDDDSKSGGNLLVTWPQCSNCSKTTRGSSAERRIGGRIEARMGTLLNPTVGEDSGPLP